MIIKGTRQSGNFRRGINLYIPNKKIPIIAKTIPKVIVDQVRHGLI